MRRLEISPAEARQRLDVFLTRVLGISRHQVQKLIQRGAVVVGNDLHPTVHRWLKAGEQIVVMPPPVAVAPAVPSLNIVNETADYLVLNKPSGVLVHRAAGSVAPTLTSALLVRYPHLAAVGEHDRPGIVHRLDRDVSGLLVVAKTPAMYNCLHDQFQGRKVMKRYTALVAGVVAADEGMLNFPIARSLQHRGRMAARPTGQAGRSAQTRFEVLQRFRHYTLLALELVTGRTHQIRVHLQAFGHPLVGDPLYGPKTVRRRAPTAALTRPFLQATALGFFDLSRHWHEFTVPLDDELQEFLGTLGS